MLMRLLDRLVALISALLVAGTTVLTCVSVFMRYVMNSSLPWAIEISGFLLVWISFFGAYLAFRQRQHLGVDILIDKLPERFRRIWHSVIDVGLIVLFAMIFIHSLRWVQVVGGREIATAPIERGVFIVIIPIACVLCGIAVIADLFKRWSERT